MICIDKTDKTNPLHSFPFRQYKPRPMLFYLVWWFFYVGVRFDSRDCSNTEPESPFDSCTFDGFARSLNPAIYICALFVLCCYVSISHDASLIRSNQFVRDQFVTTRVIHTRDHIATATAPYEPLNHDVWSAQLATLGQQLWPSIEGFNTDILVIETSNAEILIGLI